MTHASNDSPTDDKVLLEEVKDEKLRLVTLLQRSRQEALAQLREVDDFAIVYPESGWRVKDVLGHIAAWEREALASLQAYSENDVYTLGDEYELEAYNEANYQKRKEFYPAQCRIDWGMVRRDLQFAVHDLSPALFLGEMYYPWGKRGSIAYLIEEMVEHEEKHVRDILQAVGQGSEGSC